MQATKNLKIFCVDDELFTLHLSEQVLKNLDYQDVSIFQNGSDCLAHLEENPDVVFLDYNMNGLNGLDVLKKIKKYNPSIYVVMLSAQTNKDITLETIDFGAFTFMKKEGNLQDSLSGILKRIAPRISSIQSFLSMTTAGSRVASYNRTDEA